MATWSNCCVYMYPHACTMSLLILADRQDQPVFGQHLEQHLRAYKCDIAVVIEECISAIRENWMDTEGLFRLAASSAKIKFLKVSTFSLSLSYHKAFRTTFLCPLPHLSLASLFFSFYLPLPPSFLSFHLNHFFSHSLLPSLPLLLSRVHLMLVRENCLAMTHTPLLAASRCISGSSPIHC